MGTDQKLCIRPQNFPPMIYRIINQFLESWFQSLDAWLMFYIRMQDLEHKIALIQSTREMMEGFLSTIEELETEALLNLPPIEEEKTPD